MKVTVSESRGLVFEQLYNGILLKAEDGQLGICERGGSFEINVIPNESKNSKDRAWHSVDMKNKIIDSDQCRLNSSEALMGFVAWLTTRDQVVTVSATHEVYDIVELVKEFVKINRMPEVRDNFTDFYKLPGTIEEIDPRGNTGTPKCKGVNCNSTDGKNHSKECIEEHELNVRGIPND